MLSLPYEGRCPSAHTGAEGLRETPQSAHSGPPYEGGQSGSGLPRRPHGASSQ